MVLGRNVNKPISKSKKEKLSDSPPPPINIKCYVRFIMVLLKLLSEQEEYTLDISNYEFYSIQKSNFETQSGCTDKRD